MKESEECVDEKQHPLWHKVPDALLHHTSYHAMLSSWKEPFTTINDNVMYSHLLITLILHLHLLGLLAWTVC